MGIRIEKIAVKNLGPIQEFKKTFGNVNLIYAKNESGKSLLVEFIIRSLFKQITLWGRLRVAGQGKVYLSGLNPDKLINFSPSSNVKLEDYFERDERGLPVSLGKLLVVKEGEVGLVRNDELVDKDIIKELLSSKRILDQIDENISKTIKNASFDNGIISIEKRGEGKKYYVLKDTLERINKVIEKVVSNYEQGTLKELNIIKDRLEQKKELILRAKRYKAFLISEEIKSIVKKLNEIPEEELENLEDFLHEYEKIKTSCESLKNEVINLEGIIRTIPELEKEKEHLLKAKRYLAFKTWSELEEKKKEFNQIPNEKITSLKHDIKGYREKIIKLKNNYEKFQSLKKKTEHYEWVSAAKENYRRLISTPKIPEQSILFPSLITTALIIISVFMVLLGLKFLGVLFLVFSFLSIIYSISKLRMFFSSNWESKEIEAIKKEFKKRFNEDLTSLTQLESKFNEINQDIGIVNAIRTNISELDSEVRHLKNKIQSDFELLLGENIPQEKWDRTLSELEFKRTDLEKKIKELEEKLAKLDIDDPQSQKEDPGIEYDKERLEEVKRELENLNALKQQMEGKKAELIEKENEKNNLVHKIQQSFKNLGCEVVEETDWKNTLRKLKKNREDLLQLLNSIKGNLEGLGVSEKDFVKEDPGIEYVHAELEEVEEEIEIVQEKIKEQEIRLNNLKSEILSVTGSDYTTPWNELIEELFSKKAEIEIELKEIEAQIIGGIMLHETIEELITEENQKLNEGLNSNEVRTFLYKLTGRYKELIFDSKDLIVGGDYDFYPIKDLSTGAKEQTMLALRIGFTKRLLKEDSAFLILDDAFQHSDYDKRPILVRTLFELANEGWQIIYLTMDEHIKKIFEDEAKISSNDFKMISIN